MNRRYVIMAAGILTLVVIGMYAIFNLPNDVEPDTTNMGQYNTARADIPNDLEIQRSIADDIANSGITNENAQDNMANNQALMEPGNGQNNKGVTPEDTAKAAPPTTKQQTTPSKQQTTPPRQQTTTPKQQTTTPKNNTGNTQQTGNSNYASEVVRLVNEERRAAGLSELSTISTLTSAANKRAQETEQQFSHTRPNGSKFSTVLEVYNVSYNAAGENIAYGQRTPKEVVDTWMNSPGHRANIMNSKFGKIGVGVYESNGVIYWVQLFTN